MESEHDGEGGGGQQLLVVVVVQAVSRCQGKSVPNLEGFFLQIVLTSPPHNLLATTNRNNGQTECLTPTYGEMLLHPNIFS